MISPLPIIRIPILPFGVINSHLILGPAGSILVDAGLPGSETKIEKALKAHGRAFKDIKLIVITHAHVDHAGNAARLRELSGAPIVAHADDIHYFRRDEPMTFCPTSWSGRLLLKSGFIAAPYRSFEPDILLAPGAALDLQGYGVGGTVSHTPGHTAGSISVELGSSVALVGDLIASGVLIGGLIRTSHAKRPPFEDDPRAVGRALQRLLDAGLQDFYIGHGGPLKAPEVQRHVRTLMAIREPSSGASGETSGSSAHMR